MKKWVGGENQTDFVHKSLALINRINSNFRNLLLILDSNGIEIFEITF